MNESIFESGVGGLICKQCEDILIEKLSFVRGILEVKCSYLKGKVTIKYDSEIINEEKIKEKLEKSGFPIKNKSRTGMLLDIISILIIIGLFFLIRFCNLPSIPKADNNTSYFGLFLIGLVTGTHCMVMCGGIMLSQTSERNIESSKNSKKRVFSILLYNISRVLTGAILGLIFGSVGKYIIFSMKAKSMMYTFTAIYIIFVALSMWGVPFLRKIELGIPSLCDVKKKNKFLKNIGPFLGGVFTAILPCASSNSMWLIAVSSGNGINGMLTMLSWGIGTIPCMLIFGLFSSFLSVKKQAWMIRINIILMLTLGFNLLYMGINMMIN